MNFSRNILALGAQNQQKLQNTRITIIGSNLLAEYILGNCIGLGIKEVNIIANNASKNKHKSIFLPYQKSQTNNLYSLTQAVNKNFPWTQCRVYEATPSPSMIQYTKPDIVVHADATSHDAITYAHYAANAQHGSISKETVNFSNKLHNEATTAPILGALIGEEIRKSKVQYNERDKTIKSSWLLTSKMEVPYTSDIQKPMLVVGAGGIGTYCALTLALYGCTNLTVLDYDTIESHNLNRQLCYVHSIGKKKCQVLTDYLKVLNPQGMYTYIDKKIGVIDEQDISWIQKLSHEDSKIQNSRISKRAIISSHYSCKKSLRFLEKHEVQKFNLVLGCVDNKYARLWLDHQCHKQKITYIDGGTNVTGGQVATFAPNKSAPIRKQLPLYQMPVQHNSCADQPQPSIICSNMIIGALMATKALQVNSNVEPLTEMITYSTLHGQRIYSRGETYALT